MGVCIVYLCLLFVLVLVGIVVLGFLVGASRVHPFLLLCDIV